MESIVKRGRGWYWLVAGSCMSSAGCADIWGLDELSYQPDARSGDAADASSNGGDASGRSTSIGGGSGSIDGGDSESNPEGGPETSTSGVADGGSLSGESNTGSTGGSGSTTDGGTDATITGEKPDAHLDGSSGSDSEDSIDSSKPPFDGDLNDGKEDSPSDSGTGECNAQGQCVCDATSCPYGCCNGNTCVPYADETNASCGAGGAACAACPTGVACNKTAGICLGCGAPVTIDEGALGLTVATNDQFGAAVAVSGGSMLVSAPGAFGNDGMVYALSGSRTSWGNAVFLTPNGGATAYGKGLALSGSNAVTEGEPNDVLTAWVFSKTGPSWFPQANAITPSSNDGGAQVFANNSLALDGDTFVVGGFYGAAVYQVTGGASQQISPSDYTVGSGGAFGFPVAISGDTILVGGEPTDSQGQIGHWGYVFVRSGGVWSQQARLVPSDLFSNSGPNFRFNVAVDGDTAVLATTFGAYVFTRSGTTWTQTQKILPPIADNLFGSSVALQGNTMVIGAYSNAGSTGEAYVFGRSNGTWITGPTLTTGITADSFGISVSVSQGTVAVGAPTTNVNQNISAGAVYLYSCTP